MPQTCRIVRLPAARPRSSRLIGTLFINVPWCIRRISKLDGQAIRNFEHRNWFVAEQSAEESMAELEETAIRERAHQLWEAAGKPEGKEDHFWLEAERQLKN